MSTVNPRRKPKIEFNDLSYKSWVHTGHDAEEFTGFDFRRSNVIRFFNAVDLNMAPLRQTILSMVRIMAFDYNDDGEQLGDKKNEYLYYVVEYSGRDQWKQKINSGEIIEGRYQILRQEQEVSWRMIDGKPQEVIKTIDSDTIIKYTIPFSKKAVDSILEKHGNIDRKEDIVYTVKFGNANLPIGGDRYGGYNYDEFVSSEWNHLRYLANIDGGSRGNTVRAKMDPNALKQVCNCSKCNKEVKHKNG